jgi:diguanylate cyclase (GGDEF)-like protein/putative nucleotidyltransferase with HDIG domain
MHGDTGLVIASADTPVNALTSFQWRTRGSHLWPHGASPHQRSVTTKPSVDVLIQQAHAAQSQGRFDQARALFESALYRLRRAQDGSLAASLLRWIGTTYEGERDLDAAFDCLNASVEVASLVGDSAELGHTLNSLAAIHHELGELERAEALFLDARSHAVTAGDTRLAAATAHRVAMIAQLRGDPETTLRYFRTSLAEFRTLGAPKDVLVTLNHIGKLCVDAERWEEAGRAFEEAVQIAEAVGEPSLRVLLEVNRADLEILRGDFIAARAAAEAAQSLSVNTADRHANGEIEKIFGTIAREAGELAVAEEHLDRAQKIAAARNDLLLVAETAREHAELCRKQGRHRDALMHLNRGERAFVQLRSGQAPAAEIERRHSRLERTFLETVRHWSGSIESKDRYTQGHCERVADLACALALRAGATTSDLFWIRIGAIVHDVGKLIVPSELLNKPGRLATDEWELVKRHTTAGVEMLSDMDFPGEVIPMVRSHHERWDGQGYPDALAGDAIPRSARILGIADVYDALTTRRSYKASLTHDAAMEIMRADVGRQFDPELFALFDDLMQTRAPSVRQQIALDPGGVDRSAVRDVAVTGPNDDLTGVLTRRPFVEYANKVLVDRGPFASVSIIVIDVDEFKQVNDNHGHLQGDAVLRVVAGTLRELAAVKGVVARYAGDEFVILLPHTSIDEAAELAERIRTTVRRAAVPLRERSGSISVSLSIGVAAARVEHRDFDGLFEAADRALYEAKRRGRDIVVTSTESEEQSVEPTINLQQFVGREDEWDQLVRLLESAVQKGPHLAFVIGEAGVGKSTLVRRLSSEVRLCAGRLVTGRCAEADAKPRYAPWSEAIQQIGAVREHDKIAIAQLVRALSESRNDTGSEKYALLSQIVSCFRRAAANHPVVLVLEDFQWAHPATWDVLEHLMAQLDHERILICVTLRSEDTRGEALARRNRLLRHERFYEIKLNRLEDTELSQWATNVFGGQTSPELVSYLMKYSEGNPLLATQLLRSLLDEHIVRFEHGRWGIRLDREHPLPAILTGLMERRLDRLSPPSRKVLNTAAVIGRVFDVDVAMGAGAGSEDEILDALDECIAEAVLEPARDTTGTNFSFTHQLLVEAVHRTINPLRLSRIHERVAEAMAIHSPDNAAEIAIHYDRSGSPQKAFRHAMRAGANALAIYHQAEARRFFEIADRAASNPVERAHALARLAEVAETEGRYALTEELCDRALAGLANGEEPGAALALRRMRERTRALQTQSSQETIAVCRELLITARQIGNRFEEASLLNMISQYQGLLGEWAEAEEVARAAVAAAEASEHDGVLAEALAQLGGALMRRQSPETGEYYNRALALFHTAGDRAGEARCYINIGVMCQNAGDVIAAEVAYDRALEASERANALDLAGLASLHLGTLSLRRGQLDAAGQWYRKALEQFTESSNDRQRLATLYNMAHLAREADDWSNASALYEQVITIAARIGQPDLELGARAGQALAALAVGARSVAEDAMRWIRTNVEPRPEWWFQGRDLVDALRIRLAAERGEDAHALRLLYDAVAIAGRYDPYVAAFLVAECAPSLRRSTDALITLIDQISPDVEALGFAVVAERLSVLRVALAGATQAA